MPPHPYIRSGDNIYEIETPALVVDLNAMGANLQTMARFTAGIPRLDWRPHAKTHKCIEIAKRQIAAGAIGICVQKTSEAEVFSNAGIADILVTNQVVDDRKLRRLAALAKKSRIGICCDDADNVRQIAAAATSENVQLDVLIEIETGAKRAGVNSANVLTGVAVAISEARNLNFRGLQAYNGPAQHKRKAGERAEAIEYAVQHVKAAVDTLKNAGLHCETITGGGTGTFPLEAASNIFTEIQPGSFIFMDADYARNQETEGTIFEKFQQSLFVMTTVTSVRKDEYALVDAGHKTASVDSGMPVVDTPDGLFYARAADEYGVVEILPGASDIKPGTQLRLVPGHCDPTVNLHDWIIGYRDGIVECVWPIDARGALL